MQKKFFGFEWELLESTTENNVRSETYRAKMVSGWMIRHVSVMKNLLSESMAFVIDKDHEWMIVPKIEDDKIIEKEELDLLAL